MFIFYILSILSNIHSFLSQHEGWMWRLRSGVWQQRFVIIFEGVLFLFETADQCDRFRSLAARGGDSVFIATPLAECTHSILCLTIRKEKEGPAHANSVFGLILPSISIVVSFPSRRLL